jgi:hypothetical protein
MIEIVRYTQRNVKRCQAMPEVHQEAIRAAMSVNEWPDPTHEDALLVAWRRRWRWRCDGELIYDGLGLIRPQN